MHNKKNGFSIYELLVVIAILGALVPFIYSLISDVIKRREAMQYADFTKTYASKFIDEIKNNYADYYESATSSDGNTTIVIPFSKIRNNVPNSLNWGILPCVSMKYNPMSKEMQAIMFYTDNASKARVINRDVGIRAMNAFGVGSGYYESGVVNGISGAWSLSKNNDYLNSEHLKLCDTHNITNNGLVINLNMLSNFPRAATNANGNYLSRIEDTASDIGDEDNANTMLTDLMLKNGESGYGIFAVGHENTASNGDQLYVGTLNNSASFNKVYKNKYVNDGVALFSKDSALSIAGGGLKAHSINPSKVVDLFTPCTKETLGAVAKLSSSNEFTSFSSLKISYLICSYSHIPCGNNNSNYCFLPPDRTYHYTFSRDKKKTSFSCPHGMYIDLRRKVELFPLRYFELEEQAKKDTSLGITSSCIKQDLTVTDNVANACVVSPRSETFEYTDKKSWSISGKGSAHPVDAVAYSTISTHISTNDIRAHPNTERTKGFYSCACEGQLLVNNASKTMDVAYIAGVSCTFNPAVIESNFI